jgi:hypothetical protein
MQHENMDINTLHATYNTELHQALAGQKDAVIAHMKHMINERLYKTDGENDHSITLEDLESVREGMVKGGKVASMIDAYALEALYQVANDLDKTQITTADKKNFLKLQAGDETLANATMARIAKETPEFLKGQNGTSSSPFNTAFNNAQDGLEEVKQVAQNGEIQKVDNTTIAANELNNVDTGAKPA